MPLDDGVPSNEGAKLEYLPKRRYFTVISSCGVEVVADRYRDMLLITTNTGDELFMFINLYETLDKLVNH